MKITKWMRFALIALSVVMALSLFACGDPEETTTAQKEETSENKTDATTESKGTEATDSESTEPDKETTDGDVVTTEGDTDATTEGDTETTEGTTESGSETTESGSETTESGSETTDTESESETETTETTEAPCEHVEEVIAAVAATCTEAGLTEGKKCSVCGEILVAQEEIAALGHTEEVVPGKAATCTETGLTEGKKCSVCGEILVAQEEIPAGHTEETVEGKAATCTETGLTEGKKCSVCGEILVAQEEIPATGHTEIERGYMAPTTAEAGWEAHKYCEACGTAWSTEGEALDAVPTLPMIVPESEVYLGVVELGAKKPAGGGKTYKDTVISADRTFVRYERDGTESVDGSIMLLESNTEVTGQYFVMKYRTDHMTGGEFWANTTQNGHHIINEAGEKVDGAANKMMNYVTDGEWHLVVMDLSKEMSKFVQADENGNYTIQWSRLDCMNTKATEGYFDIAYIVFCDDLNDVAFALQEGDNELCSHIQAAEPVFTDKGDNHTTDCALCGTPIAESHSINGVPTWNEETQKYSGTCKCGAAVNTPVLVSAFPNAGGGMNCVTAEVHEEEGGFVRYTVTKDGDKYIHVYAGGTAVSGKYALIKYRVSNGGNNAKCTGSFSGTVPSPTPLAASGSDQNKGTGTSGMLYGDGQWRYITIACDSANFTANEDGTYSAKFLRIGLGDIATDGSAYVDVAEVAWADNPYALEKYAYENGNANFYVNNLDASNCSLDGAEITASVRTINAPIVLDLEGKTATSAADSLVLGGWVCVPGGVASYKVRVTTVDGEAVAEPALVDWAAAAANRGDIYTAVGKGYGMADSCAKGAGLPRVAVDLSAYAGHKINMEVVAITNYGAEIVVVQVNNLTVAAAAAAE